MDVSWVHLDLVQVFGIFGFTNEDHIGKIFFPTTEVLSVVYLSLNDCTRVFLITYVLLPFSLCYRGYHCFSINRFVYFSWTFTLIVIDWMTEHSAHFYDVAFSVISITVECRWVKLGFEVKWLVYCLFNLFLLLLNMSRKLLH